MPSKLNKIAVPAHTGAEYLEIQEILRCEGVGNYTVFHLVNGHKIISSKGLGEYERELSAHNFFRIHKTHLVNLAMVTEYVRGRGGSVKLTDGSELVVSRYRKQDLLDKLDFLFPTSK